MTTAISTTVMVTAADTPTGKIQPYDNTPGLVTIDLLDRYNLSRAVISLDPHDPAGSVRYLRELVKVAGEFADALTLAVDRAERT